MLFSETNGKCLITGTLQQYVTHPAYQRKSGQESLLRLKAFKRLWLTTHSVSGGMSEALLKLKEYNAPGKSNKTSHAQPHRRHNALLQPPIFIFPLNCKDINSNQ
jgi:hypothetical protein